MASFGEGLPRGMKVSYYNPTLCGDVGFGWVCDTKVEFVPFRCKPIQFGLPGCTSMSRTPFLSKRKLSDVDFGTIRPKTQNESFKANRAWRSPAALRISV
jgi:hypothetical protein